MPATVQRGDSRWTVVTPGLVRMSSWCDGVEPDALEVDHEPRLRAGQGDAGVERRPCPSSRSGRRGRRCRRRCSSWRRARWPGRCRHRRRRRCRSPRTRGSSSAQTQTGLGVGQEVDQVDGVGVVAEEHRPRPAHLDHDLRQRPDLAVADQPARLDELRVPAPGVVDVHRHARPRGRRRRSRPPPRAWSRAASRRRCPARRPRRPPGRRAAWRWSGVTTRRRAPGRSVWSISR